MCLFVRVQLTGLAVLGVGVWLFVDQSVLKLIDFVVADQSTLFRASAILLIVLGTFVVVVSMVGFVGAVIEQRRVLTAVSLTVHKPFSRADCVRGHSWA